MKGKVKRIMLAAIILISVCFTFSGMALAVAPQITDTPTVTLRTQDGRVGVNPSIRVQDLDGIDTLTVTVERVGVFGPFPLSISRFKSSSDSDTSDNFSQIIDSIFIPESLRAGDYHFKVTDGTDTVTQTISLSSSIE